ncbi:MAG: VPLPA-CTERM sorting domain-containing protein [Methylomonas sp.]|nr:VPLPA-CTERM sorting domain-containing protein [Methylomonas sp.]PPD21211.1 MAG: hypothetical protein CTY23_06160 [Methylomonas sp.]PPD27682.1 MAG: hypothetical protein CTY22_01290 [Methylomonas sp.]PPD37879.1 MAG: hypothetical protein CTY17_10295 [Methylomonas sp.]PPD39667.1 MAG: hypothetical protein CTY21_01285 [Methylomonas sp.]
MKKHFLLKTASLMALLMTTDMASAHVGWRGRDLITDATSSTANANGSTTYVYDRGDVTSNFGWMDGFSSAGFPFGAYDDWGDSHRVRFTKFYLDQASWVSVTVDAQNFSRNTTNNNVVTRLGDLNPGFSIYSGSGVNNNPNNASNVYEAWRDHTLVPQSSYDWPTGGVMTPAHLQGKEGLFVANGNITMATDNNQINTQFFTGHSAATLTGNTVSLTDILLSPGWYSLVVGGTRFDGIPNVTNLTTRNPNVHGGTSFAYAGAHSALDQGVRGFNVALTVRPVPVPAAVWLFGSALVGLVGVSRRKHVA